MRHVLRLVVVVGLIGACAGDETSANDRAVAAAEDFLLLIDQGNYEKSWTEASEWLRNYVDSSQWADQAGRFRHPLGVVRHRELSSIEFHDSLEDMPDGSYALVFFDSSVANSGRTTEMVGLMLDRDSTWRVIGYQTL